MDAELRAFAVSMTRHRRFLGALLAAALLGTAPAPVAAQKGAPVASDVCAAFAGTRAVCVERIAADFSVLRSGNVMVTESLTVRFDGEWNGYERVLVERATRAQGGHRDIDIDILGAADARGAALRTETERSGDDLRVRMWVPGARDATHTIVLRYRIENGVTFFDEHDEFYWNVWGGVSTSPVAEMVVRVVPPTGASGLRADAVAGTTGSAQRNAVARIDGSVVRAATTAPLYPGNGFTVVAGWDAGIVERPTALESLMEQLAQWWSLVLPVFSLVYMWRLWDRRGRDPAMLPIVAQYEPPADITPGEVGTLLDERADMRDVTATLVDLAVQGRLRIEEIEGTKLLGMEFGEDFRFVETAPDGGMRPAKRHEALLMSALFGGRGSVELSDLKNEFYRDLPGIREAMMDSLIGTGVYVSRPDKTRALWAVGSFALGFLLFFLLAVTDAAPLALLVVPPLTALPVLILGWLMPRRTVKGTRTIGRLHGFREFLERVDGDRLRRMNVDPSAFEKLLPYAMAFGVEKKWAEAFDGLAQEPPRWYHTRGGGAFRPTLFVSDLGRMSTAAASTMSSRPGSSGGGGSGFGGGISVGGGGGGGGGGGF